MWIIVATVLFLYLLGFLFICYLNAESHGNPSTSDNNSLSASNNPDERENFWQRYHPRLHRTHSRYHRLFFSRLVSSNYHGEEGDDQQTEMVARQGQHSSDPSRSALFAYRQQQLRQIHHEINEMSYLLGASQNQSDQRAQSVPVPILSQTNIVHQPLRSSSTSNYFNWNNSAGSRYSFIHQLMSSAAAGMNTSSSTTPADVVTSTNANNNLVSTPGGSNAYHSCGSSSLSYSPSGSESCHIVRERQRRLRHIRMDLEGLSLQLSNVDDRCASGITPPQLQGTRTTTSSLLMSVSPSSAGTTFGIENNLGDSSSLFYFAGGNPNSGSGNSWSDDNDDDDLPGYESIVCLVDSREQDGSHEMEESPPPSYSEAVHLYSFGERGERKK